jgi:hypothetical protein
MTSSTYIIVGPYIKRQSVEQRRQLGYTTTVLHTIHDQGTTP